jgi:hypothetical protein
MSRKQCRRRVYDPFSAAEKLMRRNCGVHDLHCASPVKPLDYDRIIKLGIKINAALSEFASGSPVRDDWNLLAEVVNTVVVAIDAELFQPELRETVGKAEAALIAAGRRFDAGNGYRFDGPGLIAVREVVAAYEAMISECDQRTVVDIHQRTKARCAAKVRALGA